MRTEYWNCVSMSKPIAWWMMSMFLNSSQYSEDDLHLQDELFTTLQHWHTWPHRNQAAGPPTFFAYCWLIFHVHVHVIVVMSLNWPVLLATLDCLRIQFPEWITYPGVYCTSRYFNRYFNSYNFSCLRPRFAINLKCKSNLRQMVFIGTKQHEIVDWWSFFQCSCF